MNRTNRHEEECGRGSWEEQARAIDEAARRAARARCASEYARFRGRIVAGIGIGVTVATLLLTALSWLVGSTLGATP